MLVPLLKFKLYRNFFRLFERGVKGQFHQLSMCSFYVRRSRKRNISVKSSVSFNAFGIRTHKSCTKNVDEIDTRSQPCFKLLLRVLPKNRGSILRSLCGMYCILVSTINDVTIFKGFRRQRYCPQYQKNNIVRQLNYRKDILNNSLLHIIASIKTPLIYNRIGIFKFCQKVLFLKNFKFSFNNNWEPCNLILNK